MFIVVATSRILSVIFSKIAKLFGAVFFFSWDATLALLNLIIPNYKPHAVVAAGSPGHGGLWPEYVPPKEGDSRCSCPALNALANHGILPHDGKNITFRQLEAKVREVYNFAPSFCWFVPNNIAGILDRDYKTDSFDLSDIDVHNGIEHDASLTREDAFFSKSQGKPSIPRIQKLLQSGTGPNGDLTTSDLSQLLGQARVESKRMNPQYSQAPNHKLFGSSNASTLLTIFGGKIDDIRPFLLEERIPTGWQPRILNRFGLTVLKFNQTVFKVELGIKEELSSEKKKLKRALANQGSGIGYNSI
ncbi:heme-thiolate peroxidase [Meripilus lineatus]|uniref:Heme-thiolate peroxidase n=1 Tax=Meripilus lineatus TaxID=2056292 RepID=A0AAD5UZY8_9APHY|nr:heme-thiolate peroxidase [Physisporinus lineatus]